MSHNPRNPDLPYFECEPFGLDYYAHGKVRFVNEVELNVGPDELFAIFEEEKPWTIWAKGIVDVEWTSPKPFRVGTTRTVRFVGGMEVYEVFTAWETGRHMAFCFTGTSQEVWKKFGENYVVTDLGGGRSKLVWTVAYEPTGVFKKIHPLVHPIMKRTLAWYMRRLKKYARQRATQQAIAPAHAR